MWLLQKKRYVTFDLPEKKNRSGTCLARFRRKGRLQVNLGLVIIANVTYIH